jgi:hypothetical protein
VWAGAEALHFVAVWIYVGGLSKPDRGLPPGWYAVFLSLRVIAVGYLVWRVWHTAAERAEAPMPDAESLQDLPDQDTPEATPSRGAADAAGGDADTDADTDAVVDELAGDFTDAPDRLLVRLV